MKVFATFKISQKFESHKKPFSVPINFRFVDSTIKEIIKPNKTLQLLNINSGYLSR